MSLGWFVSHKGGEYEVTAYEDQVAHLQLRTVGRVRDASGSDVGHVEGRAGPELGDVLMEVCRLPQSFGTLGRLGRM